MTEQIKFGQTRLSLLGKQNIMDPIQQIPIEAQMWRGAIGEGRILSQLQQDGYHIIFSDVSGGSLRVRLTDTSVDVHTIGANGSILDGRFSALLDPNGSLWLIINSKGFEGDPQKRYPDIHPGVLMEELFPYFANRGKEIRTICASWRKGDNYDTYKAAVDQGLSPLEAAKLTWTGQQAARFGYHTVIPVLLSDDEYRFNFAK